MMATIWPGFDPTGRAAQSAGIDGAHSHCNACG